MNLTEKVKSFFKAETPTKIPIPQENILNDFDSNDIYNSGAFFDSDEYFNLFSAKNKKSALEEQKAKIMMYRNLAKNEDVAAAIDEIINEIIYSDTKTVIKIQVNEENEKIKDAIIAAFEKIIRLLNMNKNAYNMIRQSYIDGQIVIHCEYNKNQKEGLEKLKMIEPVYFYFDKKTEKFKYMHNGNNSVFFTAMAIDKNVKYDREEIVRETYGIMEGQINLSYLEYAIKSANRLKTLEDLLIPLRFSRSISRRVFNVDTGELSSAKSLEAMRDMQKKFKYKKFYNTETGEVTNQQHITSMVEDYWFANRSGGKGTTVDLLDETGNLGEINDILYFQKKLYKSLKVPANRISNNTDSDQTFDYDSTQVTKEDMKFFMFIQRIRKVYIEVLQELLRRELISTEVMTDDEWTEYKDKIEILFQNESLFLEKMKLANFTSKLDIYSNVQEFAGKLFPVEYILKTIFNMTDDDIVENFKKIAQEKKDKKYEDFYKEEEY